MWANLTAKVYHFTGSRYYGDAKKGAYMCEKEAVTTKAGAIAFRRTGDPALGDFEDAVILGRYGETPDDLAGFTSLA